MCSNIDISYVLEFDILSSDEGSNISGPGLLSMSPANNIRKTPIMIHKQMTAKKV